MPGLLTKEQACDQVMARRGPARRREGASEHVMQLVGGLSGLQIRVLHYYGSQFREVPLADAPRDGWMLGSQN